MKIALTGGIGAGKTTAAQIFQSLGVTVIDCDQIAKDLVARSTPLLQKIIQHFGRDYLTPDQTLDRQKLRKEITANYDSKKWLEALLHPAIQDRVEQQYQTRSTPYAIIEIPLLTQHNKHQYDRILTIDCEPQLQIQRAAQRDQYTQDDIANLLATQISREKRLAFSDDVIVNTGSIETMQQQITQLHKKYLDMTRSHDLL